MTDQDETPAPVAAAKRPRAASRRSVVSRLWRAASRQLDAHEAHLDDLPASAAASEADAKALATLARTVRELVALDASTVAGEGRKTDDRDAADGLRYAAELRKELARRLEFIVAAGSCSGAATSDRGGEA